MTHHSRLRHYCGGLLQVEINDCPSLVHNTRLHPPLGVETLTLWEGGTDHLQLTHCSSVHQKHVLWEKGGGGGRGEEEGGRRRRRKRKGGGGRGEEEGGRRRTGVGGGGRWEEEEGGRRRKGGGGRGEEEEEEGGRRKGTHRKSPPLFFLKIFSLPSPTLFSFPPPPLTR